MKNIRKTLFLLLLAFISSCTSDELLQRIDENSTKVTAILPDWDLESGNSRTSITTGSYPTAPSPVWVTGDSIGIYPDAGGDQLSFRINEGGSKTCTFDGGGWAMKSSSYTAYSPFKRSFYYKEKNELPISMLGQKQNGNDNADHLGAYDIQIAKGDKPEEGSLVFQFDRYVALARLEITAPRAAVWTSVTLESDASFTTEANMNLALETPTVTPVTTSNSVTLELANVTTTSDNLSIIAYMMLLPVDLTGKTLSVKLTDSEENTYSSSATITNNKTNFTANSARWISAVDFEVETIPTNQIWYTSSNGNIVTPYRTDIFGANITSNVYENGVGVITFDGDVTTIGDAFSYQISLTSITIPNSVTTIDAFAFANCTSLTSIKIPDNVTTIGRLAFKDCTSLTGIVLPNNITEIGESAFFYCTSLTSITLSNSVTNIGKYAFVNCTSLTSITIPESVTKIGHWLFSGCSSLTSIIVEQGNTVYDSRNNCNAIIETASNTLVRGCKNTIIPNTVTAIGDYAFSSCELTSITIPNSVIAIGEKVLSNCNSLINIIVEDGNSIYDSRNNCNAIIETASNTLISGCKNTIIPNTVATIGNDAFSTCSSLTSITIPEGVTKIGEYVFLGCTSLTSITIPNSVTEIGEGAFADCTSLTNITIPNSVTEIGEGAFSYCTSLTSITIPNSVTEIGGYAFEGCSSLTSVYVKATTPPTLYDVTFNACSSDLTIYVPAESLATYQTTTYWKYLNLSADNQ